MDYSKLSLLLASYRYKFFWIYHFATILNPNGTLMGSFIQYLCSIYGNNSKNVNKKWTNEGSRRRYWPARNSAEALHRLLMITKKRRSVKILKKKIIIYVKKKFVIIWKNFSFYRYSYIIKPIERNFNWYSCVPKYLYNILIIIIKVV